MASLEALSRVASDRLTAEPCPAHENEINSSGLSLKPLIYPDVRKAPVDWTRLITIEERKGIRDRIKSAYQRKAPTYEELLDACSAIEEEFLFTSVPSKLDYFKSGVQFEKRIVEKQSAIRTSSETTDQQTSCTVDGKSETKRAKTDH